MKNGKQIYLMFFFSIAFISTCIAEVKLPAIVSSGMVLQRNTTITLWGWAEASEEIMIYTSWLGEGVKIIADKNGDWKVDIKTTNTKEHQNIRIKSIHSDIILDNILFGEVWLCSGQSNMAMPLSGFKGQPTYDGLRAVAYAKNENLRLFTVNRSAALVPQNNLGEYSGWMSADSENAINFSAVAYFFGQQLQKILDVPVGLIHSSWGGSLVEAWISKEALSSIQDVNLTGVDLNRGNRFPTVLFNGMINPLIPYTIKGAIWYQGEANASSPELYKTLFPAMVKDWRKRWKIGDFPFYYVQIAPYMYHTENRLDTPNNSALMREAQLKCLELIPNSGIVVTLDIGDNLSIHPPNKKEVSNRLLYNALNLTYGFTGVDFAGPAYDSLKVEQGEIILEFKHAETGLYTYESLEGFEIAATDKVFYPAVAKIIDGTKILVKNDNVPNPVAVRYAWRNWTKGTLYDTNLLPASSFRTDNWNDARQSK